jgi:hypothetical protein
MDRGAKLCGLDSQQSFVIIIPEKGCSSNTLVFPDLLDPASATYHKYSKGIFVHLLYKGEF